MCKSNREALLYNLSATKFIYSLSCDTALGQLDHYFSTVGNGLEYDPQCGLKDEDYVTRKMYFIAENHTFDFAPAIERREERRQDMLKQYNSMVEIFGDKVPSQIGDLYNKDFAELAKPFEVMDDSYYFSFSAMSNEMIEKVRIQIEKDPHNRLQISNPYPLSEYSILSQMKSTDNPLMVELALAMCKSWIEVLGVYIQQEWYLTAEDVEKYQGVSYYYSLEYINKCIENFERIIVNLSVESEND